MSEYDEGGSTDVEDVAPGLCSRPVPPRRAWPVPDRLGAKLAGKPKDPRPDWGSQVRERLDG
jgi:hypothetical protein